MLLTAVLCESESRCLAALPPQVLEELRSEGSRSVTTLAAVVEMAARRGVGERDALLMLRLFNELGLVMHHPEPALRHLVVLNPATFFVHPASLVVSQHNYHELPEHARARRAMHYEYNRLGDQGLARRRLLRMLWSEQQARQEDLEQLMVRHGLMFPLVSATDGDRLQEEEEFLVPAVLPRSAAGNSGEAMLRGMATPVARAVVVFADGAVMDEWRRRGHLRAEEAAERGFLPDGLFAQVQTPRHQCKHFFFPVDAWHSTTVSPIPAPCDVGRLARVMRA